MTDLLNYTRIVKYGDTLLLTVYGTCLDLHMTIPLLRMTDVIIVDNLAIGTLTLGNCYIDCDAYFLI